MRFNLLSSLVVGLTGVVAVFYPSISAALAGFALSFASSITHNVGQTSCEAVCSVTDHDIR